MGHLQLSAVIGRTGKVKENIMEFLIFYLVGVVLTFGSTWEPIFYPAYKATRKSSLLIYLMSVWSNLLIFWWAVLFVALVNETHLRETIIEEINNADE